MAFSIDAGAIRRAATGRYRARVFKSARLRNPRRHVCVRRLPEQAVFLRYQIRQRHRLAEFLAAVAGRRLATHRHDLGHGARRKPLPPLRRASGPRVRRRPAADRLALLHERRSVAIHGGGCVMKKILMTLLLSLFAASSFAATSAPEIAQPDLQWFNVEKPVSMASLRGRIVILDFWTEGCINCIHIIPILRGIEQKFPEQVAVIGIHSPKFAEEKNASSVEDAIKRYEIRHPIVHDPDLSLWKAYGVQAWPTLVIVGADVSLLGKLAGEPDPVKFPQVIASLVDAAGKNGDLKPAKLALKLEEEPKGRFLFPGKLKALPGAKPQWVLADSGHNQIVLLDDSGADVKRFGSGAQGFKDGDATSATFDHPQGLIASDDAIFVADTGNHAIRRIDLASGAVTTLAGNGKRGTVLGDAGAAKTTSLASPWDLEKKGDKVYFGNAGTHQIGVLDLGKQTVARLAGSGAEELGGGSASKA